ncbi:MAG: hypothetical protein ACD_62C00169G0001, partial [uncultured bacterium]
VILTTLTDYGELGWSGFFCANKKGKALVGGGERGIDCLLVVPKTDSNGDSYGGIYQAITQEYIQVLQNK